MAIANPYDQSGTGNPYLGAQANAITQQANQNLNLNVLPGIASGAVAAGGYGGSRQGVAEGVAAGLNQQGISNSLANLYGNNYQADQQNALQGQSLNNQYNLGLGSLGVQSTANNNQFYTQQRSLDQSGAQLGANLYNAGNAGYISQGTGIQGIGNTQQQAPWLANQNAGNIYSQFSNLGGGQTATLNGSALGGALGAGLAGAQLGKSLGNLGLGTTKGFTPAAQSGTQGDPDFYN